jgi:hypothetical protein
MSGENTPLPAETHARIFVEQVIPKSRFNETTPQAKPSAVILAGQPGAGKGNLARAVKREFSGNIVVIDPDAQRDFFPDVDKLREAHPLTWSGSTHNDAKAWSDELRDLSIEGRRNVNLDVTLAGADPVIKQIHAMQDKGYEVEIRAVATHRLESELGVDQRFTSQLASEGYGRHVPGDFQDFAYKALPANLDRVQAETGARIRIYNREGVELYDSHTNPMKPGAALEQAREARMTDPKITHATAQGLRDQQEFHRKLPETLEHNPAISRQTARNLPPEREAQNVVARIDHATSEATAIDRAIRIEPGATKVATGLKVLGTAAIVADAYNSGSDALHLYNQGNNTGAQSEVLHFTGRNLGMVGGAMAAGAAGAAAGIETGPGALVTGFVGGVVGGIAGDKIMDKVDQLRIYNQTGSDGKHWHLDPQGKEGWTRTVTTNEIDPHGIPNMETGEPAYKTQTLHASGHLVDELNYKASNVAVELALAHPHRPQDPFTQPASRQEAAGGDWVRNPQTHAWNRNVDDPNPVFTIDGPITSTHVETASPQRSAQLEQAAQATIANNMAQSPHGVASRYQESYDRYGWNQNGPVPQAVIAAAHTPPSRQLASDGHEYNQGSNGEWTTPGTLYGVNTAQPNVRDELNATRQQEQAQAAVHASPGLQPHTAAQAVPPTAHGESSAHSVQHDPHAAQIAALQAEIDHHVKVTALKDEIAKLEAHLTQPTLHNESSLHPKEQTATHSAQATSVADGSKAHPAVDQPVQQPPRLRSSL